MEFHVTSWSTILLHDITFFFFSSLDAWQAFSFGPNSALTEFTMWILDTEDIFFFTLRLNGSLCNLCQTKWDFSSEDLKQQ